METAKQVFDKYGAPDVITFTNVFAHIENLPEVIQALRILISSKTLIVIENHYLGSVLEKNQFDTFYHEHPRTYGLTSFKFISRSLGLNLQDVEFPKRYGGNIRIFMGFEKCLDQEKDNRVQYIMNEEKKFEEVFFNLHQWMKNWKKETVKKIKDVHMKNGKLIAKAFPGRAAILVKILGLDNNIVEAVYEKPKSMKIGHYLPGTKIPIVSDNELFTKIKKCPVIINLAWHIPNEISTYLKDNGFTGEIINVVEGG